MKVLALPVSVLAGGLGLWVAGLAAAVPWDEWLAQALWAALWLVTVEWCYGRILRASAGGSSPPPLSWRARLAFAASAAALLPLTVVAETWTQWLTNRVLYQPGHSDPTYLGLFRGIIDTSPYLAAMATTDEPLSAFTRLLLGWQDEVHPFATVVCSGMVGDALWAPVAMAIGTGALRHVAPAVARAFRLAALQAATAPLFMLAYFFLRGGDGLNVWSGLLAVLAGTIDAGGQVPAWVRIVGVSLFYLVPAAMVAWRLRADRRALALRPRALASVAHSDGGSTSGRASGIGAVVVGTLAVVWMLHLSTGPWSWIGQCAWLALWLAFVASCFEGVMGLGPRGGAINAGVPLAARGLAATSVLLLLLPLVVAGLVVQVGFQWIVAAAMLGPAHVDLQFFGWFLGQVRPAAGAAVPPVAVAAAFAGNALWAWALLRLAARAWHEGRERGARVFRLGALQAASTPSALCAFMVLSIVTRDRAAPGMPRFDVWHAWTHLARAALDASFATEAVPAWLPALAVAALIGLPIVVVRRAVALERATWRAPARVAPVRRILGLAKAADESVDLQPTGPLVRQAGR
jgi:hypothetical protein